MIADKLRKSVLKFAVQGKLTTQLNEDGDSCSYFPNARKFTTENQLFDIPKNWVWLHMGEIVNIVLGQSPKSEFVNTSNGLEFHQGKVFFSNYLISKSDKYCINPSKISREDSVLLCVRAPVGIVNYSDRELCIGRGLASIEGNDCVNVKYIYRYLETMREYFEKKSTGSTFKAITSKVIRNTPFALPPLSEQKRIVEKLDRILPMIDALENDEKKLEELMAKFPLNMRQSLLLSAIKGELTTRTSQEDEDIIKLRKTKGNILDSDKQPFDIPENWAWTTIDCIGDVIGGGTPKTSMSEYWGDDIPWLTPADMRTVEGKYVSKGKRNISDLGLQKSSARLMPKGTVVFSSRAPIGYCAIAENELSTNQGFKSIVPYNKEMSEYIYYYLLAYKSEIEKLGTGTTFKEVSGKTVKSIPFALPPLEEQKHIVEKLDKLLPLIDKLYT